MNNDNIFQQIISRSDQEHNLISSDLISLEDQEYYLQEEELKRNIENFTNYWKFWNPNWSYPEISTTAVILNLEDLEYHKGCYITANTTVYLNGIQVSSDDIKTGDIIYSTYIGDEENHTYNLFKDFAVTKDVTVGGYNSSIVNNNLVFIYEKDLFNAAGSQYQLQIDNTTARNYLYCTAIISSNKENFTIEFKDILDTNNWYFINGQPMQSEFIISNNCEIIYYDHIVNQVDLFTPENKSRFGWNFIFKNTADKANNSYIRIY